jgi:hypothetical protein
MHATKLESVEIIFREDGTFKPSHPAPAQGDFVEESARAESDQQKG